MQSGTLQPAVADPRTLADGLMTGLGDTVLMVWEDGRAVRWDTRDLDEPRLVEELDVLPDASRRVTAAGMLLGRDDLELGQVDDVDETWFNGQRIGGTGKLPPPTKPAWEMV